MIEEREYDYVSYNYKDSEYWILLLQSYLKGEFKHVIVPIKIAH
jgi:hypothetical protein